MVSINIPDDRVFLNLLGQQILPEEVLKDQTIPSLVELFRKLNTFNDLPDNVQITAARLLGRAIIRIIGIQDTPESRTLLNAILAIGENPHVQLVAEAMAEAAKPYVSANNPNNPKNR